MANKKSYGPNQDRYREAFKQIDKNNDGYLSIQELRDIFKARGSKLTDREIADFFVFFDGPSGDKRISFDEFCKGIDEITSFCQKLRELFDEIDTSGNGFLDKSELKALLSKSGKKYTDEQVDKILKEADKNHDNQISFEEFIAACT